MPQGHAEGRRAQASSFFLSFYLSILSFLLLFSPHYCEKAREREAGQKSDKKERERGGENLCTGNPHSIPPNRHHHHLQ